MAEGTRITCEDLSTGETESVVIKDDYVVVTDGRRYVSSTQLHGGARTAVITIKTEGM